MGWAGQGFSGEILRWQYLSPSYSSLLLLTPRPSRLNTLDGAHTSTPSLCLYDHTRILRYVHNNPLLLQRGARPNSKLHTSLLAEVWCILKMSPVCPLVPRINCSYWQNVQFSAVLWCHITRKINKGMKGMELELRQQINRNAFKVSKDLFQIKIETQQTFWLIPKISG